MKDYRSSAADPLASPQMKRMHHHCTEWVMPTFKEVLYRSEHTATKEPYSIPRSVMELEAQLSQHDVVLTANEFFFRDCE